MRYVVGIDGGGTKTTAAVVGEDGKLVASATSGPSNRRSVGMEPASANIAEAVTDALKKANVSLDGLAGVCMCLAGFDTDLDLSVPQRTLRILNFEGPAIFENDVVGAWAGATAVNPGIVVIAGTGATALGMNKKGEFWRTDGWDTLLGDQGSGYALGLAAIHLAMRMFDGRIPPSPLVHALSRAFGVHSAEDMRRLVDSTPFGKYEVASFARYVSETAREGDPIARDLLRKSGETLAENVAAIVRILGMKDEAFPISTVGSMIRDDPWVTKPFEAAVKVLAPRAVLRLPLHPPEIGAALLCFERLVEDDLGSWTLGTGKRRIRRSIHLDDIPTS
jgi:N-acetylglucosamine kinase-like BadF-type ATPase